MTQDWRNHIDQMHTHTNTINASLAEMLPQLNKLQDEISRTLEKIISRETYVNGQLEHRLQDYRGHQDELAEIKERYRQASGGVTELTRKLAEVLIWAFSGGLRSSKLQTPKITALLLLRSQIICKDDHLQWKQPPKSKKSRRIFP